MCACTHGKAHLDIPIHTYVCACVVFTYGIRPTPPPPPWSLWAVDQRPIGRSLGFRGVLEDLFDTVLTHPRNLSKNI
eukprot:7461872-Pyramimonas_sp.AAC.1